MTGHFPPNMWEQTVPYKVLQMLQYPNADVKYYNHSATEVVKQSVVWYNFNLVGADNIRLTGSETPNSYVYLPFTGAKYVKIIHSSYYGSGWNLGAVIKIEFSTDGGTTYVTPESLGLTSSYANNGTNGRYTLPTDFYKFGHMSFSGLSESTSYIIKVTLISGKVNVWGFETWSKPRINVIVTAEGGNVAADQLSRWYRFYSKMYNPALIIYELPYLNDLGVGIITNFKGIATTTTTPAASPAINDFWQGYRD